MRSVEIDWIRALVWVLSVTNADLRAGEADRLAPQRFDGHGHQRHAHLLAGREQHVHLAGRRMIGDLVRQIDEHVGIVPHRAR